MEITSIIKAITTIIKRTSAKQVIKSVGKYSGRKILRRSGVFGTYGSVQKYAKLAQKSGKAIDIKALGKNIAKKNLLRSLGKLNYVRDTIKKGVKYTLKQILWQNITPMEVKKLYYYHQNYKSIYKRATILTMEKKELWGKLNGKRLSDEDKLKTIDRISRTRMETEDGKKWKNDLLDDWFVFNVKSTSHNFNQYSHKWNPARKIYHHPIRSGSHKYTRLYTKTYNVSNAVIKKMLLVSSYGKQIYWPHFRKRR